MVSVNAPQVIVGGQVANLQASASAHNGGSTAFTYITALVRAQLDRPERVRLYRQMSGGAWVFEMVPPDARDEVPAIVDRLRASGALECVEIDPVVTIR